MKTTQNSLSVIVATWRRPHQLRQCLAGISAQARAPDDVLVVVRPDDQETRDELSRIADQRVTVVDVEVSGVVAALNAGRTAARTDLIAFTDDDAVPDLDWLARIASHFAADPRLGAVGGRDRLAGYDDPPVPSGVVGRILWYGRMIGEHHRGEGPAVYTDVLKGVNIAFRRAALEPVGFDERLRGAGAQAHWEVAVCLGIKRAGWGVLYDPAVAVAHDEGPRFGSAERGFGDLAELAAATHNQTYAMIRWLPPWRKLVVFAYEILVGSRIAPGVLMAVERGLRTRQWRRVLSRLGAATRGRLEAVGTYKDVVRNRS